MTGDEITFYNVTITLPIKKDAKEAYAKLCDALASLGAEWETDTYEVNGSLESTEDLFG